MTRTVTKIERIVYVFTRDEVIDALVETQSSGEQGKPCGKPHRHTFRTDGTVEFIYDFVEPSK